MNRYTQLTPSQFNPLSMQEIFSVPLAKQQRHDQAQASLDELGLFDINRLQKDDELAQNYINNYTSKLDEEINKINASGINNQSINRIKQLSRERNEWLKQGQGKSIQDNYNAYINNKKQLDKLYEKGTISANKYQLGLQKALQDYKGVKEGGTYIPFVGVADTDYVEIARKTAKDISENPIEIERLANLQLTPDGSMYIDMKTGQEFTPENAIKRAVTNVLFNDENVVSDLLQREQLGLFNDRTANDVITDLANEMELNYRKNNKTIDRKLVGNKGYSDSNNDGSLDTTTYNEDSFTPVNVLNNSSLEKLKKVGNKKTVTGMSSSPLPGVAGPISSPKTKEVTIGINNSGLTQKEQDNLQNVVEMLNGSEFLKSKLGLENTNLNDPKTAKIVANYIEKFQNKKFVNYAMNPNSDEGKANSLPKTNINLKNKTNDYLKTEIDAGGIKLYDMESGKPLDENDLSKHDKYVFRGYFPPSAAIEIKGANEDMSVSPGQVLAYDDEGKVIGKYYTSRPTSDIKSKDFQVAKILKNITLNTLKGLGSDSTVINPMLSQRGIDKLETNYDIDTDTYEVSFYINEGEKVTLPERMNRSDLEAYIKEFFNN